jgi:CDP-glycerol glycerophosphotransferase (TagB/SpsB family)
LILTSARTEYDSFFSPDSQYNYNDSIVQLLGLPRHDFREKLEDRKEIVVMPSWRRSLEHLNEEQFKNSEFYMAYNSLLTNEKLIEFLDARGYTLIFKPHHNLNTHLHLFERHPLVEFDNSSPDGNVHTYNEIFNHSSLLITDYSSAVFDFAYIKKPILYYHSVEDYHFDIENSFFDYEKMGFGEIAKSLEGLVNLIMNYVNCNCEMKDKYKKRVDDFFEYHDKNNCKRVYEFILNDSVDEIPQELDAEKTNEILINLGDDFYRNIDYEDRITKERIKNNQLREAIEGKDKEIEELNKELERKQKEINTLLGSNSWKVTKPLRKITEMLKNNKGD